MRYAVLFGLAATANAINVAPQEKEVYGWNLKQWDLVPAFFKEASKDVYHWLKGDQLGGCTKAVWTQCEDDKGVFKFDAKDTVGTPDPIIPG